MIECEWQYIVTCDACGRVECVAYGTKAWVKKNMKMIGWRIVGNGKAFCPECAKRRKAEVKGKQA